MGRPRRVHITQAAAIFTVALVIIAEVAFLVATDRAGTSRATVGPAASSALTTTPTQRGVPAAPDTTVPASTVDPTDAAGPSSTTPSPTAPGPTGQAPAEAAELGPLFGQSGPSSVSPPPAVVAGSASILLDTTSCIWESSGGGTLHAAGTVTNLGSEDDTWLVDVTWIENGDLYDSESDFVDTAPRQTQPWAISLSDVEAPAGALTCSVELS